MMDRIKKFYDDLADDYHLIFEDWDTSIQRQSNVLDKIIKNHFDQPRQDLKLFDCSWCDLTRLLSEIGFTDVIWHLPEETGYYQPIVTARRI